MKHVKSIALGVALLAIAGGCGSDNTAGPLGNVEALVILQRPKRNDMGDIFQYTSYIPGAQLVKLSPPTADGTLTVLCCDKAGAEFANIDISGYDISFDAKRDRVRRQAQRQPALRPVPADARRRQRRPDRDRPGPRLRVPIFLPGDKIMFTTNAVVEPGAPQHSDEYERGTTIQMGTHQHRRHGRAARPAQPVAPHVRRASPPTAA